MLWIQSYHTFTELIVLVISIERICFGMSYRLPPLLCDPIDHRISRCGFSTIKTDTFDKNINNILEVSFIYFKITQVQADFLSLAIREGG